MVSAQIHPQSASHPQSAAKPTPETISESFEYSIRSRQSLFVGCLEMERILQKIILPELKTVGKTLIKSGKTAEIVLLDTQSPLDGECIVFSVGLKIGSSESAIVFTADPELLSFSLQIQLPDGTIEEKEFRYHELIPQTIRRIMGHFLETHYPRAKYSQPEDTCRLVTQSFTPPFRLQIKTPDNIEHVLAVAETFDDAMYMASTLCQTVNVEDSLMLLDAKNEEVA